MKKVLAVMLATLMVLAVSAQAAALPDLEGHWSQAVVEKLIELEIVRGYEDGTFRPENGVTIKKLLRFLRV